MYVVMNVLDIAADKKDKMAEIFSKSGERMKQVPGCLEFLYLDAPGENKQIVYTKWETKDAFVAWRDSEEFRTAHQQRHERGITASGSKIEVYEVVHSSAV